MTILKLLNKIIINFYLFCYQLSEKKIILILNGLVFFMQALQYVQENPDEVCLARWKPGDKYMKPDPKGRNEYFAAI